MSNADKLTVHSVPDGQTDVPVEKRSFVKKATGFVKNHKKVTIAVAALSGLVVASSLMGKKRDSQDADLVDEIESTEFSENDTTVA